MLYFYVCYVEYARTIRFDFSYRSSRREPFLSDTELDSSNVGGLATIYLFKIIGYGVVF